MNRALRLGAALAAVLAVASGCAPSSPAEHTVEYYRAHDVERRKRLKSCTNDPGTYGQTPDCINAVEAERLEGIGSFKDLPPLQLPAAEAEKGNR